MPSTQTDIFLDLAGIDIKFIRRYYPKVTWLVVAFQKL